MRMMNPAHVFLVVLMIGTVFPIRAQSPNGDVVDTAKANEPENIKVLFLGNSFTFMWDVPGLLTELGKHASVPKKIYTHQLTWGGKTLTYYWDRIQKQEATGNFQNLLKTTDWDYVVLQRWDNDDVKEIVPKFAEIIHAQNPKTKILLYEWGGAGKMDAPPSPPIEIQTDHEAAAHASDAFVIPVAWAWYQFRIEKPGVVDVAGDGWHPGYVRAYMTACALYATMFHETPVGLQARQWQTWAPPESKGIGKVTDEEAAYLQGLAWTAVQQHSTDPFFQSTHVTPDTAPAKSGPARSEVVIPPAIDTTNSRSDPSPSPPLTK